MSVNGFTSDLLPITCGVPQGSVLWPLLFLIYVNDLPSISKVLKFYLFADDTSIYFESDNLLTLQKIANSQLQKVKKWLDANQLALNIGKTNYAIFHSQAKKCDESNSNQTWIKKSSKSRQISGYSCRFKFNLETSYN